MKALLGETLLITKRSCKAREFGKMITNKMHMQKCIIFLMVESGHGVRARQNYAEARSTSG